VEGAVYCVQAMWIARAYQFDYVGVEPGALPPGHTKSTIVQLQKAT
jgi:hypothetical protein